MLKNWKRGIKSLKKIFSLYFELMFKMPVMSDRWLRIKLHSEKKV